MVARVKNVSDYAHAKGLELHLYKGDQSWPFDWTQPWMRIQASDAPPVGGWPTGAGFCPSSEWGQKWVEFSRAFLEATHVDGSSCDYCWILAPMSGRPDDSIGCHAHNHSHAHGAGQWENLRWWINLTLRDFALPAQWQPTSGSGRYTYGESAVGWGVVE
jgi:hypothetical protein